MWQPVRDVRWNSQLLAATLSLSPWARNAPTADDRRGDFSAQGFIAFNVNTTGAIGGMFEKAFHFFRFNQEWEVVGLLVGFPVLYAVSFGPACWVKSRTEDDQLPTAYLPIGCLICYSPPWISDALAAYATAGMPPGSHVYIPVDSDSVIEVPETP